MKAAFGWLFCIYAVHCMYICYTNEGHRMNTPKPQPVSYSEEVAEAICEQIATSAQGIRAICAGEGMPSVKTVMNWLNPLHPSHQQSFLQQYVRAREAQADLLAQEILEIADDKSKDTIEGAFGPVEDKEWVNRSKLRVDARKWLASKLAPKKYGDRLELDGGLGVTHAGSAELIKTIAERINHAADPR